MALTLGDIRTFVRTHMDLDVEDLPDAVLDIFIREGSKRVEQAESRWPFYETFGVLTTTPGVADYDITTELNDNFDQLVSLTSSDGPLTWVGADQFTYLALDSGTAIPTHFSQWGQTLSLWPTPNSAYSLGARYYRLPGDWTAAGAGGTPDLPDQLHNTVAVWALAKAYAQQEDPEMAQLYERQFADELQTFRRRIAETPHPQPLILNGGSRVRRWGRLRYDWESG